ncbi:protein of unassigned function [Methylobacterium oryzae CBMB20]|jgi:hypothetical protein|uniref:Protein of unassigned function n=1 Tax=Methylobacterium oryzae CBMB20 TaxID=693986 RepID=A0A089Q6X6_9HYPH|nr:protein of unassigned function [Methylobacterium oryzae CBMB20]
MFSRFAMSRIVLEEMIGLNFREKAYRAACDIANAAPDPAGLAGPWSLATAWLFFLSLSNAFIGRNYSN